MTALHAILAAHADEVRARLGIDPEGLAVTYLTPRFATSRNVIGLASDVHGSVSLVAKLARDPGDASLAAEANILEEVANRIPDAGGVPRLVILATAGGSFVLVETVVQGRPLTRHEIRRRRSHWVHAVLEWTRPLADIGPAPLSEVEPAPLAAVLDRALGAWADVGYHADITELVDRTAEVTASLRHAPTPIGVEHGDLAPPNLLVSASGELGVVDWELGRLSRVPLHDLAFFVSHVAWVESDGPERQRLKRLDVALGRNGWARRALEDRAGEMGIPADDVLPLVVTCWARYAAGTLQRVRDAGRIGAEPAGRMATVRRLRAFVVWRHLVERVSAAVLM